MHSAWRIKYEGDIYFFLPHLPLTSIIPYYFYLFFSFLRYYFPLSFRCSTHRHSSSKKGSLDFLERDGNFLVTIYTVWLLYSRQKKNCSFCTNSLERNFSDVVHLDPSFHGIGTAWTDRYCGPIMITFGTAHIIITTKLFSKFPNPPWFQASAAMWMRTTSLRSQKSQNSAAFEILSLFSDDLYLPQTQTHKKIHTHTTPHHTTPQFLWEILIVFFTAHPKITVRILRPSLCLLEKRITA